MKVVFVVAVAALGMGLMGCAVGSEEEPIVNEPEPPQKVGAQETKSGTLPKTDITDPITDLGSSRVRQVAPRQVINTPTPR